MAMENFSIFIVEDDKWYGQILEYHLSMNPEYLVLRFNTGKDCLKALSRRPDLITLDYRLPDMTGDELYRNIKAFDPSIPVIVISAQENVSTAVDLLKAGVTDYIVKDENSKDILWRKIAGLRETGNLRREVDRLREELGHKYNFEKMIVGDSPSLRKVFSLIEKACKSNINVSVTGETGTGKELVAKAIHYNSERKKRPFVTVNMAAIPSELAESELFGHEKGAFTGAVARKTGKFEEANSGTLFLDEIGELNLTLQTKLLRALQEREITRVGGNENIRLDIRLIVATHKNLADEVEKGAFREDLYYRVMGLSIELPPLREREKDILTLARHFLAQAEKENNLQPLTFSAAAAQKLLNYAYPGNVRELKTVVELAAVMSQGSEIEPDDISFKAIRKKDLVLGEEKTLKEYTIDIIRTYLKRYDNNVVKVAEKLDIGKSTIYKMIQLGELSLPA